MISGRTFIPKKDMILLAKRCFNKHSYYVSGNNVRCGENYMNNNKDYITYIYFDNATEYDLDKTKRYKTVLFSKNVFSEKMLFGYIYHNTRLYYNDVLERDVDDSDWMFVEEEDVSSEYLTNLDLINKSVTIRLTDKEYSEIAKIANKNKKSIAECAKLLISRTPMIKLVFYGKLIFYYYIKYILTIELCYDKVSLYTNDRNRN